MRKPREKAASPLSKSAMLRKQMDDLKSELRRVEVEEEAAFGKMGRKAGLFELDVSEKDLREAVATMVETFRGKSEQKVDASTSSQS